MSVLKTLKLGKAVPTAAPTDTKERARAKVVAHLEQQKSLLAAHLEGRPYEATRPFYRMSSADIERWAAPLSRAGRGAAATEAV